MTKRQNRDARPENIPDVNSEIYGSNPLCSTRKLVETTVVAPGPECLHPPPPNQGIIALICKDAVAIRTPNRTRRATRVSLRGEMALPRSWDQSQPISVSF